VPEYCTCGAKLPPDARFCHKCGKPQFDYPNIEEPEPVQAPVLPPPLPTVAPGSDINFRNRKAVGIGFIVAVLAMFAVAAVTQVLPSAAWVIVGFFLEGMAAAFAYSRLTGQHLSVASGARLGWIAGIFSFAFTVTITTAVLTMSRDTAAAAFTKNLPPGDPRTAEVMKMLNDPAGSVAIVVFTLVLFFVLLTTLTMLGGALGAKLSDRRA
jgi:hypothetical protein